MDIMPQNSEGPVTLLERSALSHFVGLFFLLGICSSLLPIDKIFMLEHPINYVLVKQSPVSMMWELEVGLSVNVI